jgi:hypothetical protein
MTFFLILLLIFDMYTIQNRLGITSDIHDDDSYDFLLGGFFVVSTQGRRRQWCGVLVVLF